MRFQPAYLSFLTSFVFFFAKGPFATFHLSVRDSETELTDIKFSSDGKSILVSTTVGVVYLLDAFQGHQLQIFTVRFDLFVLDFELILYKIGSSGAELQWFCFI